MRPARYFSIIQLSNSREKNQRQKSEICICGLPFCAEFCYNDKAVVPSTRITTLF